MRARPAAALALASLSLWAGGAARADLGVSGFMDSEYLYADQLRYSPLGALVPPPPASRAFVELDVQPRLRAARERVVVAADLSLYLATAAPEPLILLNEGYASLRLGPLSVLAGRRRVVWGSGLALNPTDLVNPPRLLLDPGRQRTGAFLVPLVDVTAGRVTMSAFFAPRLATDAHALPRSLDFGAGIAAARLYSLIADSDVSLMAFRDFGADRWYLGASVARVLGDALEIHAEGLAWSGPPEPLPLVAPECSGRAGAGEQLRASVIAGARYDWPDRTSLSLEYLVRGRGLTADDFAQLPAAIACTLARASQPPPALPNPVGHPVEPPLALLRRHYAIAMFQREHLSDGAWEDVGVQAIAAWGIADGSLLGQLRATWRPFAQGTLGGGVLLVDSVEQDGEFALWPTRVVLLLDTRVSF